jgi:hypothetical protein
MPSVIDIAGHLYTIKRHVEYLIPTVKEVLKALREKDEINILMFQDILGTMESLIDTLNILNSQSPLFFAKSGLDTFRILLTQIFESFKSEFDSRMIAVDVEEEYVSETERDKRYLLNLLLDYLEIYNKKLDDLISAINALPHDEIYGELTRKHQLFNLLTAERFLSGFTERFKKIKQSYDKWSEEIVYDVNRLASIPEYDWYTDNKTITLFNILVDDIEKYAIDLLNLLKTQEHLDDYIARVVELKSDIIKIKKNPERRSSFNLLLDVIDNFKYILDDIENELNNNNDE